MKVSSAWLDFSFQNQSSKWASCNELFWLLLHAYKGLLFYANNTPFKLLLWSMTLKTLVDEGELVKILSQISWKYLNPVCLTILFPVILYM